MNQDHPWTTSASSLGDRVRVDRADFFYRMYPEAKRLTSPSSSRRFHPPVAWRKRSSDQLTRHPSRKARKKAAAGKEHHSGVSFEALIGRSTSTADSRPPGRVRKVARGLVLQNQEAGSRDQQLQVRLQEFLQKETSPPLKQDGDRDRARHRKEFVVEVASTRPSWEAKGPSRKVAEQKSRGGCPESFFGKGSKTLTTETFLFKS
jgi:hypothetical protein